MVLFEFLICFWVEVFFNFLSLVILWVIHITHARCLQRWVADLRQRMRNFILHRYMWPLLLLHPLEIGGWDVIRLGHLHAGIELLSHHHFLIIILLWRTYSKRTHCWHTIIRHSCHWVRHLCAHWPSIPELWWHARRTTTKARSKRHLMLRAFLSPGLFLLFLFPSFLFLPIFLIEFSPVGLSPSVPRHIWL